MGIFDFMSWAVGILTGVTNIFVAIATLMEKYQSYIARHKEKTTKDPSASSPAPDGSSGDRDSGR